MKPSLSNSFIVVSLVFTIALMLNPDLGIFGLNHYYFLQKNYLGMSVQLLLYSFLHGGILHFGFNSLFLYFFGNPLEESIGKKWYLSLFIFTTLFNAIALFFLTPIGATTIGISGFALAILSFYTLILYSMGNDEYKGGITAIIINVMLGFTGNISLVGHLFGAIAGGIFYVIYRTIRKIRREF